MPRPPRLVTSGVCAIWQHSYCRFCDSLVSNYKAHEEPETYLRPVLGFDMASGEGLASSAYDGGRRALVGPDPELPYTASAALLDSLHAAGIEYIFANFGSDHAGIVEALARARALGRPLPTVITCPNEMVAMSAAHGYAQVTGRPQAVFVHVDCGTQALAGAMHNAAKGRIPVFVFAGTSPVTQSGELEGSRNEFIQWIQDVHDQRGGVRGYVRYDNEVRAAANIQLLVYRSLQFACSDPKGPVYLNAAREVLEGRVQPAAHPRSHWQPVAPAALPVEAAAALAAALSQAEAPLVVTSFAGRNTKAVGELVALCDRLGFGVLESAPNYVNFPHDNWLYQGNQWNEARQNEALRHADLVLVVDSDVPWIPAVSAPRADAKIFHIDVDPLKQQMPLWYIPAIRQYGADAETALRQINAALGQMEIDEEKVTQRHAQWRELHDLRRAELSHRERRGEGLTPEALTAAIRQRLDSCCVVINEGVSNYSTIFDHLAPTQPGTMFTSGGGSLGWNGGAAIGAKLANPDKTVVALTGDGSYMFSLPSTVHWMARRYATPFLTVIYNNGGWKSPKLSALAVHPEGYASRAPELDVSFEPQPDYGAIAAAAGGALALTAVTLDELDDRLERAFNTIRNEQRCVVLDVHLPRL